jgi:hypothetical protein
MTNDNWKSENGKWLVFERRKSHLWSSGGGAQERRQAI